MWQRGCRDATTGTGDRIAAGSRWVVTLTGGPTSGRAPRCSRSGERRLLAGRAEDDGMDVGTEQ
jgi:hypothetical protein